MRRSASLIIVCALALVAAFAFSTTGAQAALTPSITEFNTGLNAGSAPNGATAGPDGNVWFTDKGTPPAIGFITPAGNITEFSAGLNAGSQPGEITTGPDGNLWFTDTGTTSAIGRITPAGAITEFSAGLNPGAVPSGITADPDGKLWFTDSGTTGALGQVTTAGVISEFSAGLNAGSSPSGIAAGSDGNLWFLDDGTTTAIGRVTTSEVVTEFSAGLNVGSSPSEITKGPDGNVWFTDGGTVPAIGKITPAGAITEYSAGLNVGAAPLGITVGSDQNLWFADAGSVSGAIGQVTPAGVITEFGTNQDEVGSPTEIAPGSDGNLWFTDPQGDPAAIGQITTPPTTSTGGASAIGSGAVDVAGLLNPNAQFGSYQFQYGLTTAYGSTTTAIGFGSSVGNLNASATASGLAAGTTYHYRIVATNGTGATPGADATFKTLPLPVLGPVTLSSRIWRLGRRAATFAKRRKNPVGTTISFTLDRPVLVEMKFSAERTGRKKGKNCRRSTRKNRRGKRCTLLSTAGKMFFNGRSGANKVRFDGRVSKATKLKPGHYRVDVIAKDLTTSRTVSRSAGFVITERVFRR